MNNNASAESYLRDAESIMRQARDSFTHEEWHRVVRLCQESTELCAKSLLKYMGIDYPKWHNLKNVLIEALKDKNILTHEDLETFSNYVKLLAEERIPSFYGDENAEKFIPASEIYKKPDADEALEMAEWVIGKVQSVIKLKKP